MRELRRIASLGIPDGAGIRPVVWKVFIFLFLQFGTVCISRFSSLCALLLV